MRFIGDVHGHFNRYKKLLASAPDLETFQIGDMGLGFGDQLPSSGSNNRFIRGNHDAPDDCKLHPNYAGEFGFDPKHNLFFAGGGFSIDWQWRVARMNQGGRPIWWMDEELSPEQLEAAEHLYLDIKPSVVATHDCPDSIRRRLLHDIVPGFRPEKDLPCRTATAFEKMFTQYQPKIWIFGHYHVDVDFEFAGTRFICLAELSHLDLDI